MTSLFYKVFAILFLIAFASQCISQNVVRIDNKHADLAYKVYQLSWANEKIIRDYEIDKTNKVLIQSDAKEARLALFDFIKSQFNAGHTISKETFCKLLSYDIYNDSLILSNDTINSSKLITVDENTQIKHDLLINIAKDNGYYHTTLGAVTTLYGDDSANKYLKERCNH